MENAKENAKKGLNEIKSFYKGDFKEIMITFFKSPIDGISSIFKNPGEKSLVNSLIIFVSVFILYLVGSYIIVGEARQYMKFFDFIKIGIFPLICMFLISALAFVIKSILGKADFKNELLTGAISGIAFSLLILIMIVLKLVYGGNNMLSLISNPMGGNLIGTLLIFYVILMIINVFQQSLRSAGTKDVLAWYLSPVSVLFAIYLTSQILY